MALPELKVKIGADTDGLDRGLNKSTMSVQKFAAVGAAAFAAVGAAITALTMKGLSFVDSQAKLARSMDATANGLRAVQFAGKDAGVSVEGVNTSLQMMARRLIDARTEGTPAANAIKALGLNAAELGRMDADERIAAIADRVKEMGLSAGEASRVLQDLGVRSREMALLMIQGGDAIRAAKTELAELGAAFTPAQAAAVERANDAMERIGIVTEAISNQLAIQLAPVLEAIAKLFTDLIKETGGFANEIQAAVEIAIKVIGFLADGVWTVRNGFSVLYTAALYAAERVSTGWAKVAELFDKLQTVIFGVDPERSAWVSRLQKDSVEAQVALQQAIEHTNSLMREPMPSEKFDTFIEAAKRAAAEAGAAMGAITGGGEGDFVIPGLGGAQTVTDKMAQRLQALITSLQTERETIALWYQEGLELINQATEAELEALGGKHEAIERLNEEHQARLNELEKKAADERKRIQDNEARTRQQGWSDFWGNMESLMNSSSKKLFQIGKMAAIANSIISAYEGFNKTMAAYPYPLNIAFAGASLAASFAKIAALKATQFGGGGSAATPAPGGGTVASQALAGTGADAETRRTQTINVRGIDPSSLFTGDAVSGLIEQLLEAQRNGARVILQG